VTVKRIIADAGVSVRGCKVAGGRNMVSKFRNSHITGKHPSSEDGMTKANTLLSPRRKGEQRISQCSRHMYPFRSVTTGAAKWEMHSIVINRSIVSLKILIYRIVYRSKTVFDIS